MERFKVLRPNATESAFGYGDDTSNYATVVSVDFVQRLRNTVLVDLHVKQLMQNRPSFTFYGSAEHTLLAPLSEAILTGEAPVSLLFKLAQTTGGLSRMLGLGRSKAGVGTISQLFTNLLPSLKTPGVYEYPWADDKTKPKNAYEVFGAFLSAALQDPKTRETVFKTISRPTYKFQPNLDVDLPSDVAIMQQMINSLEIFGLSGKRQPLLGSDGDPVLSMRFNIEDFLTADPKDKAAMDNQFTAAIWYMMYAQIAQSPESYDAAMPSVPVTPQDGVIASSVLSLLGSLTQTAFSAASAPYYTDLLITIKFLEETVEFLETSPYCPADIVTKIRGQFSQAREKITDIAYPPTVSYSNTLIDYMKKLTGARYLLPGFIAEWTSLDGKIKPFSPLTYKNIVDIPGKYRGSLKGMQKVVEFGGLDMPRLLMEIYRRASECVSQAIQYKQMYDTYYSGLAMPRGSVLTHLDSLGTLDADPRFGTLEYPNPTSKYLVPSYIPKYVRTSNDELRWSLSDHVYKLIFPVGFQIDKLTQNLPQHHFTWDTVVKLPPSPSTGSDYSCLLIPFNYIEDTTSQNIANDIASINHYLSGSKNRPLSSIADFFTPIFHALLTKLTPEASIANALGSMFTLYKAAKGGKGDMANLNDWTLISPSIPFIYGYPSATLCEVNAPWNPTNKAEPRHVKMSPNKDFMIVLHRKVPKPHNLSYFPYTMAGSVKLSMPVRSDIYNNARLRALKALNDKPGSADAYYVQFCQEIKKQTVTNELITVTHWSKTFAFFPHLFVSNRHVHSMSAVAAVAYPSLIQRLSLTTDAHAYLASVLTYIEMPVIGFSEADDLEAISTPDMIININDEVETKKVKAVVEAKEAPIPTPKLEETTVINKEEMTERTADEQTDAVGKTEMAVDKTKPHMGSVADDTEGKVIV